jgi:hypothetical protein
MSREYTHSARLNLDREDGSLPAAGLATGALGGTEQVPAGTLACPPGQFTAAPQATGWPISAQAGQLFLAEVGAFRCMQALHPEAFRPLIDWGDGSPVSLGVVARDGTGVCRVYGDHFYARPRNYTIHIVVPDPHGGVPFQDCTLAVVSPRAQGRTFGWPRGTAGSAPVGQ